MIHLSLRRVADVLDCKERQDLVTGLSKHWTRVHVDLLRQPSTLETARPLLTNGPITQKCCEYLEKYLENPSSQTTVDKQEPVTAVQPTKFVRGDPKNPYLLNQPSNGVAVFDAFLSTLSIDEVGQV